MPVPELSDSVSKHRLEHNPGMDDEIWTDGTMSSVSKFPAKTSLGADRVDHNSTRSNGGIVGEGVDNSWREIAVDYSTESCSDGEQHKIYNPSQCIWNDITFTEAGDGQGIGIFPIPIATPSDHVSQHPNCEVGSNNLSIGSGTMAILNGSVMGDLVNNGMLVINNSDLGMQGFTFEPDPGYVLDASSKDQLEHGPGLHDTQPAGLNVGPIGTARSSTDPVGAVPLPSPMPVPGHGQIGAMPLPLPMPAPELLEDQLPNRGDLDTVSEVMTWGHGLAGRQHQW